MRRSHFLVRRTRPLNTVTAVSSRSLILAARTPRLSTPRKSSTTASTTKTRSSTQAQEQPSPLLQTSSPGPPADEPGAAPDTESLPDVVESESKDATKDAASADSLKLPKELNILWSPHAEWNDTAAPNSAIPPQAIMNEILTNFHITLHPQTQHKAAYASAAGPPIEPTLALYCPIEGGDYILDATVRELGHQASADVVVVDAVHLAAGESGHFGKAASALQFKHNPLHSNISSSAARSYSRSRPDDDDSDDHYPMFPHVTMQILGPALSSRPERTLRPASRRGGTSTVQLRAFFQEIINVPPRSSEGSGDRLPRRPRIIYIRDFPTLASSSSSWYPSLVAAVRERRQGALARPASPVLNPTTIIFGITPSMAPDPRILRSSHQESGASSSSRPSSKQSKPEHSEDEAADKAREKRLRERLRKWEKGDNTLADDVPRLHSGGETQDTISMGSGPSPVMMVDGSEGLASGFAQLFSRIDGHGRPGSDSARESEQINRFFRTSIVLPSVRSLLLEKTCRMSRRREINELIMRMAVSSIGGVIGRMSEVRENGEQDTPFEKMWTDWGRSVESRPNTRQIADIVVGQAARDLHLNSSGGSATTLDPVHVEWPVVFDAWSAFKGTPDVRKAWIKQSTGKEALREEDEEDEKDEEDEDVDEVVAQIRQEAEDGELDSYEQKLVSCIVDSGSVSTTFNQVHLPPHTIDSVRTIVSLPLLHPDAFSHGILKEHSMTGCLLFGPPGTGKTLLVRALAKEAGCRMLAISPSDVMDMYVGEAEKSVRAIFSLARKLSPCVVFIDEIDALFGARSSGSSSGGDHAHRGVITEFMQEMDGLKSNKEDNIMVIGATNRPFDLDDAVLRRLPRRLLIDLPGEKEREEILKILLRDETLDDDLDLKTLAHKTETFSGSDLKHLCVSAALGSVKERVEVPWKESQAKKNVASVASDVSSQAAAEQEPPKSEETSPKPPRTLSWRNFEMALKEITPSSSESLGSLADLRKWNQEFGEGHKERKRQVWGKDRFGFTVETLQKGGSKVQLDVPAGSASTSSTG